MIFDGRVFAKEIEEQVKVGVTKLSKKPMIMSILVGNDPASELYTSLKKKAAERVGIEYRVERLTSASEIEVLINRSKTEVNGIMIQLPLPGVSRKETEEIIKLIPLDKDVDGLRWEESNIMPATVRAILLIMERIAKSQITNNKYQTNSIFKIQDSKILVVGGTGAVGRPLVHYLKHDYGVNAEIANSKTTNLAELVKRSQIVISCVGRAGLITKDMINNTSIVIDVGISAVTQSHSDTVTRKIAGDMEQGVYEKARVAVPVPGGVGPVTVASLMANALEMCTNHK